MQFIDKPYGCYRIYAGSVADPAGKMGFVATLIIKVRSPDAVNEPEAFRDLLPIDGLVWRDERDALFYAVRRGEYIIDARPALLADARRTRAPWTAAVVILVSVQDETNYGMLRLTINSWSLPWRDRDCWT